nr:pleckstrin homology domain-containing family S member 1-like [Misgurnus anguillicaudatus]
MQDIFTEDTVLTVTSAQHQCNNIQMFTKKNSTATAPKVQVLYAGYLYKSPNLSKPAKFMKRWRHRFFVLSKAGEDNYQLAYYKNKEKMEKPLGEIDLSMLRLICTGPEKHRMWEWIYKNFKCLPSAVLFLRVEDFMLKYTKDYFLIGENSEDVNGWHNELLKVIKTQPSQNKETDYDLQQLTRYLSKSQGYNKPDLTEAPPDDDYNILRKVTDSQSYLFRQSEPIYKFISPPLPDGNYNIPRMASDITFSDDDEDDTEEQPETSEDNINSECMSMFSVKQVLQQNQQEEDACFQKNMHTNGLDSSYDLCNGAGNPMKRNSAELRCPMGSLSYFSDFNGNCAYIEMNKGSTSKSETHKPVEKEICINRNDLCKGLIFTQKEGKPCVSECKTETSHLFHKGDQILAFNDMQIETVDEIHTFLRRFSRDEVKLTVLR